MAEPLRKFPLAEDETAELELAPLPPALPGTPPAMDEADARAMRREADHEDNSGTTAKVGQAVSKAVTNISDSVRSGLDTVAEKSKDVGAQLSVVADRTRDSAKDLVLEAGRRAQDARETALHQVRRARREARRFAHERPLEAVAVIAGGAFVLGLVLRIWRAVTRD